MATQMTEKLRMSFKHKRPNPIIEKCLQVLHREAQNSNSKMEPMLKEALSSLSKYPLPLKTGAECAILKGFNVKLCKYIDKYLQMYRDCENERETHYSEGFKTTNTKSHTKHKDTNEFSNTDPGMIDLPAPQRAPTLNKNLENNNIQMSSDSGPECVVSNRNECNPQVLQPSTVHNKMPKKRIYRPAFRSGAYAILIALLEHMQECPDDPSLIKENVIDKAQKYSEESFVRPKADTFYTAWSNVTKLVSKGLVVRTKKKKTYYSLTPSGVLLAKELLIEQRSTPTTNDIIFNTPVSGTGSISNSQESAVSVTADAETEPASSQCSDESVTVIDMPAGSFEVILLIDKNETGGVSKKNDPTVAQFNKYPDLKHEYRSLKVGDFTWIARHKVNKSQELVLPYVVERKRMDDLGSSIKDGRFHEQKFRLRKCGLKNVIYMIENYGSNKNVGLPLPSLMQALSNTRVQDGFKIHMTDSLTNSARFLAMMTKRLTIEFKDKDLKGHNQEATDHYLMTFQYFNKSSSKSKPLTVTETFIKLLLQLKGVSVEKALAITNTYSTPAALIKMYSNSTDSKQGEMLLANLKYGDNTRNVGPKTSKAIYKLFSLRHLS